MDRLVSGYSMPCKFLSDGDQTFTIRWVRAQPGAKQFPGVTCFGSHVWDGHDPPTAGPGEIGDDSAWSPSRVSPYPGQHFHGKLEWFQFGMPSIELTRPPIDGECMPACLMTDTLGDDIYPEQGVECIMADP